MILKISIDIRYRHLWWVSHFICHLINSIQDMYFALKLKEMIEKWREFLNSSRPVLCSSLKVRRTPSLSSLKIAESENNWFWFFEIFQNWKTAGSSYLKNPKELTVFMKELEKKVLWLVLWIFHNFKNVHITKSVLWIFLRPFG